MTITTTHLHIPAPRHCRRPRRRRPDGTPARRPIYLPLGLFALLTATLCATTAHAHGIMCTPRQRGALRGGSPYARKPIDKRAPIDWHMHFPAGSKNRRPGSGHASQRRASGKRGWTPFRPLSKGFVWRSSVCGDLKTRRPYPHMRGGRYYHGGRIVATYRQGGILNVGLSINAHHNGFIELHICDVRKCGGEISENCFRRGHCTPLRRARMKHCDSGRSKACGPIDRHNPGRWYLPCSRYPGRDFKIEYFGPWSIRYRLPKKLTCKHCVLQWFWSSANTCNPPGVLRYFNGPDRPRAWGKCAGQGDAKGGFSRVQRPCSRWRSPEEYLQCADIRILPKWAWRKQKKKSKRRKGRKIIAPTSQKKRRSSGGGKKRRKKKGKFKGKPHVRDIVVIGNQKRVKSLFGLKSFSTKPFWMVSVEAVVVGRVRKVEFFVNGRKVSTDHKRPFYIKGGRGWGKATPWRHYPTGKRTKITVKVNGKPAGKPAVVRFKK